MSKIVVTGASGMLGRVLREELKEHEIVGTALTRTRGNLHRLDLTDKTSTESFIRTIKPDIIVHTAAERRPDVSQKDPEGTVRVNVDATKTIAEAAKEVGAWVLYISTDYVFDGTNPPYSPGDKPHPLNFYGETKLKGEEALINILPDAGILRLGVLYGKVEFLEESAVTIIAKDVLSKQEMNVDHWGRRYPTLVDDVAIICRQLAEQRLKDTTTSGVWHWCGNECFTKYEMAKIIGEVFSIPTDHLKPDSNEPKGAPRPRDCKLDCSKLESWNMGRHTSFREAIDVALRPFIG